MFERIKSFFSRLRSLNQVEPERTLAELLRDDYQSIRSLLADVAADADGRRIEIAAEIEQLVDEDIQLEKLQNELEALLG